MQLFACNLKENKYIYSSGRISPDQLLRVLLKLVRAVTLMQIYCEIFLTQPLLWLSLNHADVIPIFFLQQQHVYEKKKVLSGE